MPAYDWSCLACGRSNAAAESLCLVCGCPSRCTLRDVERHRARHESYGGVVGPSAGLLRDVEDEVGLKGLLRVAGVLLGILPVGL